MQENFSQPFFDDRIIIDNLTNVNGKFDFIITTNVVDFFEDRSKFINKIYNLLNDGGFIELHTYKKVVQGFIRNKYKFNKSNKFAYAFLFKEEANCFRYIKKRIFLNETFFVIKKSKLKSQN